MHSSKGICPWSSVKADKKAILAWQSIGSSFVVLVAFLFLPVSVSSDSKFIPGLTSGTGLRWTYSG